MRVRPAGPADRPALLALQSLLDRPARGLLAPALADDPAPTGPTALVAVRDGRAAGKGAGVGADPGTAGYALAVPGPLDPDDGPGDGSPATVTLAELAVAPAARRNGVGSRLVAAVAARFPDHGRLSATTPADADRALAFYRSLGFAVGARLPDRYGGDRDAVRLDRPL